MQNNAKHFLENHEKELNKMTSYYRMCLFFSYIQNKYFPPLSVMCNGYIICEMMCYNIHNDGMF